MNIIQFAIISSIGLLAACGGGTEISSDESVDESVSTLQNNLTTKLVFIDSSETEEILSDSPKISIAASVPFKTCQFAYAVAFGSRQEYDEAKKVHQAGGSTVAGMIEPYLKHVKAHKNYKPEHTAKIDPLLKDKTQFSYSDASKAISIRIRNEVKQTDSCKLTRRATENETKINGSKIQFTPWGSGVVAVITALGSRAGISAAYARYLPNVAFTTANSVSACLGSLLGAGIGQVLDPQHLPLYFSASTYSCVQSYLGASYARRFYDSMRASSPTDTRATATAVNQIEADAGSNASFVAESEIEYSTDGLADVLVTEAVTTVETVAEIMAVLAPIGL